MTPREPNYFAHMNAPTTIMGTRSYACHGRDTIQNFPLYEIPVLGHARKTRRAFQNAMRRFEASLQVPVIVYWGGVPCVLYTEARSRARRELTDRICRSIANDNQDRKQLQQNLSAVSTATASASADLAVMAFPIKTEANLAFVARVDPRTARRWLADNTEPPAEALGLILCEIMRRYHQRD